MPVFHTYVNEDGYYITARPSDVGNITYQTTAEADRLLTTLDYADGDDLPWGLINPLRAAGLIYTHGQGVDTDLDDTPDLNPKELETLSADGAEDLLAYLESRDDIPESVYLQLKELVASEAKKKTDEDILRSAIADVFPEADVYLSIEMDTEVSITLSLGEFTIHTLCIEQTGESEQTITKWTVSHSFGENWEGIAKAYKMRPDIMRAIGAANEDLSFRLTWERTPIGAHHV